jgi:RHS repeat-associated protein
LESFGGHQLDPTAGLLYGGARLYDPTFGVFTSPDPLRISGGSSQAFNPYAYANNDPINWFDPTGYASEDPTEIIVRGERQPYYPGMGGVADWDVFFSYPHVDTTPTLEGIAKGQLDVAIAVVTAGAGSAVRSILQRAAPCAGRGVALVRRLLGIKTAARAAANSTRPLLAADFGTKATIKALEGTLSVEGKVATVGIKHVEGNLGNPIAALNALKESARQAGATTLRIEATIANPRLEPVLNRILGPATRGAPGGPQDIWVLGL